MVRGILQRVGGPALGVMREVGGITLVAARVGKRLVALRMDRDELFRAAYAFGVGSLGVVMATAAFVGMIMVLQAADYVQRFGVYNLVGWYTGFSTFREVGPLLVGLMVSGRVGANNTSELATMKVTEQLDALRILALDPYEILILPRVVAITVINACLVIFGNLVAVLSGALGARVLMGVDYLFFFRSLFTRVTPGDFLTGVEKALVFGLLIAIISSHFGISARGGSVGVGRAVNGQVMACAVGIFLADYLMSSVFF